jgi:uncharacterized protein YkwD
VLCLLNAERAARRLPALSLDIRLQTAAERHSQDMGEHDFFEHVSPDGANLPMRVHAAGVPRSSADLAENLYWGSGPYGRPAKVVRDWMRSAGHRATMLNPVMRRVGIGIALDAPEPDVSGGVTYTADFMGAAHWRAPRVSRVQAPGRADADGAIASESPAVQRPADRSRRAGIRSCG